MELETGISVASLVGAVATFAVTSYRAKRAEDAIEKLTEEGTKRTDVLRSEIHALDLRLRTTEATMPALQRSIDALTEKINDMRTEVLSNIKELRKDCRACRIRESEGGE